MNALGIGQRFIDNTNDLHGNPDKLLLDRERLREWALIRAVMAAWWMIEDHATGWQGPATVAERLATA